MYFTKPCAISVYRYKITKHRIDTWYQFGVSDLVRVFITDLIKILIYRPERTYFNPHVCSSFGFFLQYDYKVRRCTDMEKKYYIALDDFERQVIVNCLNNMRNQLFADGKYTDDVDDVLLKIIYVPTKKLKVILREG